MARQNKARRDALGVAIIFNEAWKNPPPPFNPNYNSNWKDISKESHRRTREVIEPKASPTLEEGNAYQELYTQNFDIVAKEMSN